jgi:hypothetical protein
MFTTLAPAPQTTPVRVVGLSDVRALGARSRHDGRAARDLWSADFCALRSDDALLCWSGASGAVYVPVLVSQ